MISPSCYNDVISICWGWRLRHVVRVFPISARDHIEFVQHEEANAFEFATKMPHSLSPLLDDELSLAACEYFRVIGFVI